MYYVIDAVRWGDDGHIAQVRWHRVLPEGNGVRHTPPEVVPVVDAAEVCWAGEVRVYVDGSTGHFFKMKACPEGIDADADAKGTPLRERMAHLPTF